MRGAGKSGGAGSTAGSVRELVNQRIYELSLEHPSPFPTEFLCECAEVNCPAFVTVGLPEYEQLRAARGSILAPGHSQG